MALSNRIVIVVVAVLSVVTALRHFCGVCDCKSYDKHFVEIVCKCAKGEALVFSQDSDDADVTYTMSFSNCGFLAFREGANLRATRVDVRNVTSVEIERAAFAVVSDLLRIRGVASLRLGVDAFLRRYVGSLLLEDSRVVSVATSALQVSGMTRLEVTRVTIDEIRSSGIVLSFPMKELDVLIRDTQIKEIQQFGLQLEGAKIDIQNSSFWWVEQLGIFLNSSSHVRLTDNVFRYLESPKSLIVYGRGVRVTGNKFNSFPTTFLKKNLEEFTRNEFQIPLPSLALEALDEMTEEHYNNSFRCECGDDFRRNLTSLYDECHGDLLQNLFCISPECPPSVTHDQLLHRNWTRCPLVLSCGAEDHQAFTSSSSADHPSIVLWLILLVTAWS